jgi:two-component system NtrC family sensor kinase
LTVGLAHEINNKLGPILIYTQLAQMDEPNEKLTRQLEAIESNTLAIKEIIETLANFAHPRAPAVTRFSINSALFNSVKLLKYRFESEGVELRFELDDTLPKIHGDRGQLELVFLDLAANALDAMRGMSNGDLLVSSARDGDRVVIRLADNGPGLPKEATVQLLEPFFSTRGPDAGTGTGLGSAYGAIRAHGGELTLGNREDGPGALAMVTLPLPDPAAEADDDGAGLPLNPERQYRVLLVDDDQETLNMVRSVFAAVPQVLFSEAVDGDQARRLLGETRFDLVLCDIKLPRGGGRQLHEFITERDPLAAERMVFMTGDRIGAETTAFIEESGVTCLPKPFSVEEVTRTIIHGLGTGTAGER